MPGCCEDANKVQWGTVGVSFQAHCISSFEAHPALIAKTYTLEVHSFAPNGRGTSGGDIPGRWEVIETIEVASGQGVIRFRKVVEQPVRK